jgi:aspartate/methionine/tyrosine aminotransferase
VTVERLRQIPGFNIDKVAAAAGEDPDVLRMENLDTDIPPPAVALEATRAAIGEDDANSWLPFNGRADLKEAVSEYVRRRGGPAYDPLREVVITCGEGEAMLDASFPTGWLASEEEWEAIASLCVERDLWLLYWGGFEGVLFDGRTPRQPAGLPDMRERTVTVGAPSFEQRMIAWRVGWVVMPAELGDLMSRCQIYNGLVASGFAQIGTRDALCVDDHDLATANLEWRRRRDATLAELEGLPVIKPAGAWAAPP